jgi:hypothetical protein
LFTGPELIDRFKKDARYSAYRLSAVVVESEIETLLSLEKIDDMASALLLLLTLK